MTDLERLDIKAKTLSVTVRSLNMINEDLRLRNERLEKENSALEEKVTMLKDDNYNLYLYIEELEKENRLLNMEIYTLRLVVVFGRNEGEGRDLVIAARAHSRVNVKLAGLLLGSSARRRLTAEVGADDTVVSVDTDDLFCYVVHARAVCTPGGNVYLSALYLESERNEDLDHSLFADIGTEEFVVSFTLKVEY